MNVSTSNFFYDKSTRTFIAEASTIQEGGRSMFHQVYPDSCDEGISLTSHMTGVKADFYVDRAVTDNEGDVTHWILKPTPETVRRNPRLNGCTVHIFND